ncbi:hypothetical protein BDR03DRAFT_955544 [Suillus americanus]|nr:hypothetical protein BDR03DRAFT_955544 [Suillus americanus]
MEIWLVTRTARKKYSRTYSFRDRRKSRPSMNFHREFNTDEFSLSHVKRYALPRRIILFSRTTQQMHAFGLTALYCLYIKAKR